MHLLPATKHSNPGIPILIIDRERGRLPMTLLLDRYWGFYHAILCWMVVVSEPIIFLDSCYLSNPDCMAFLTGRGAASIPFQSRHDHTPYTSPRAIHLDQTLVFHRPRSTYTWMDSFTSSPPNHRPCSSTLETTCWGNLSERTKPAGDTGHVSRPRAGSRCVNSLASLFPIEAEVTMPGDPRFTHH